MNGENNVTHGFCVWLTGLPCGGKTTIARALAPELEKLGLSVQMLDGDEVRERLSRGLGFSREDRDANVLRIAFVAGAIVKAGGVVLVSAVSPFRETRDKARAEIGRFVEVHVAPPVEECIRRDVKGHYAKALRGEIPRFTGISDPYEEPLAPELRVATESQTLQESVRDVLATLRRLGHLPGGRVRPHGGVLVDRTADAARSAALAAECASLPSLEIDADTASDVENIGCGLYSPLTGFLGRDDLERVVADHRLVSGASWTMPIVLPVSAADAARLGARVALRHGGETVAVMDVTSSFRPDHAALCASVFGTKDPAHPGVAQVRRWGEVCLGGPIERIARGAKRPAHRLTPSETRALFDARGFETVAAFQTRNVPHLGHEHLQRLALSVCDGLFVNPVVGGKKPGDFRDPVILATYEALVRGFYPAERVVLGTLPTRMRYAGPMEAIHHAILRQNYGCSHLLVGRDHAGVGTYYGPYAAQEVFARFPDLAIRPLKVPEAFHCSVCDGMATTRDCPHDAASRVTVSATQIRAALADPQARLPHRMRDAVLDAIRAFDQPFVEAEREMAAV